MFLETTRESLSQRFKALGNPLRLLLVFKMLDGKPYTKEELYEFVHRINPSVTRNIVDRHIRTLEKYGVIRVYDKVRRDSRGRRPLAYILSSDALSFYNNLFSFILDNVIYGEGKGRSSNIYNMLAEIVYDVKLTLYLVEADERFLKELSDKIRSCTVSLIILKQVLYPDYTIRDYSEALHLIKNAVDNSLIRERLSSDKIFSIIISSYISTNIGLEELGKLLDIDVTGIIGKNYAGDIVNSLMKTLREKYGYDGFKLLKTIIANCSQCRYCRDFIMQVATCIIKYVITPLTKDKSLLFLSLLT